jgi:phosphoglycerate dehydrogenase-like enzyme
LIELLAPFKMNIIAVRRTPRGDEPVPTFAESEVERLLPQADHVVDVLPGGRGTEKFVNARRLSLMKPTAFLYNIGRGTTVDTDALIDALKRKQIAAAFVDVTEPEPPPANHPIWTTPNCFITPHTGGGHAEESDRLVQHFLANLKRYENGEPMLDRII